MFEKTAMFGMMWSCVVWAFTKLGWTNYFRIVAGNMALLLGLWTGHLWTGYTEMNSDGFSMEPLCISHTVLFASSLLASSYGHIMVTVTSWAMANTFFIIHYWSTYYASKNLSENYQETEMIAQTMENTRLSYIKATVAAICLVILPVTYRVVILSKQYLAQERDAETVSYAEAQDVKKGMIERGDADGLSLCEVSISSK